MKHAFLLFSPLKLRQTLLAAFLSPLILSSPSHAERKCYLPNGEVEENDAPCFPQNPESSCCGGSTYVCATNNMCAFYDGSYYVIGSCTDKSWNSPACDHIHNSVKRCGNDTYCCNDGPNCSCDTNNNTQKILDFLPAFSELVGSPVSLNTAIGSTSLFTPLGATRPATTTASSSTSSTSPPAVVTGSPGAKTSDPPVAETKSNKNIGIKVGLGVGIPLGIVAIVLATLLYHFLKKNSFGSRGSGTGPHVAPASGSSSGGFLGIFRWRKEDPTIQLPMLENTSPSEVPDNGPGNQPNSLLGFYKPSADAIRPHIIHEAP
ncbi:hypothetical protein PAAG_07818 [Paracoccidioides lutzii Pb01]|uniref:Mid2 domain-containing protein n=1 Tax=Paracoccidioides lutzii (strain ATCC MYA-826 / Pb01) TaxID=502779 RepID=C1HA89_PARBA|nr:hypothetical protein PAAG_07818 [Paracoccidioides lutzii Pb01]EEH37262.1 hypothetical protein PAAG_07818 [Paracoccidioides lutzii Pb01]